MVSATMWLNRLIALFLTVFLSSCLDGNLRGAQKKVELSGSDGSQTGEIERDKEPYICSIDVSGSLLIGINHTVVEYDLFKNKVNQVLLSDLERPIDASFFLKPENQMTLFSGDDFFFMNFPEAELSSTPPKDIPQYWGFEFIPLDAAATLNENLILVFSGAEMFEYDLVTQHSHDIQIPTELEDLTIDAAFHADAKLIVLSQDRYFELSLEDYQVIAQGKTLDLLPGLSSHFDSKKDVITSVSFIPSEFCEDESNKASK